MSLIMLAVLGAVAFVFFPGVRGLTQRVWRTGNFWAGVAIMFVVFVPIAIAAVALYGSPALTGTATLGIFAVVAILVATSVPLLLGILALWGAGRSALAVVVAIIGFGLAIGVYFTLTPVANDRGLVPAALLILFAIIFLFASRIGSARTVARLLVVVLAILTAIWFLGGREEAERHVRGVIAAASAYTGASSERTLVVGSRDEVRVILQPMSRFDIGTDEPVIIRLNGGRRFEKYPDGKILDAAGNEVDSVGDTIPGSVIHLRAKEKMARVTVSEVRK